MALWPEHRNESLNLAHAFAADSRFAGRVLAKNSLRPDHARFESQSRGHELSNSGSATAQMTRRRSIGTSYAQESESVPESTRILPGIRN